MFPWAAFFTFTFVSAYTPGPNIIMSMSLASRMGFKKSYPFNFGILAGFMFIMSLCALFSNMLYVWMPKIKFWMTLGGAAYILYLAYKTLVSTHDFSQESEDKGSFISGLLLQFVNPKLYIYGITALSVYILPYYREAGVLAAFACLLALIGFSGTIVWALFGSLFRQLFSRYTKIINTVMAVLLVYCGISLFLS